MLADHIGIAHLRDMASREESIKTAVSAFDMPRLAELLHPDADENNQRMTLDVDIRRSSGAESGFPQITGTLDVGLELICQRCLGSLSWPETLKFRLVVVESESDTEELAEPFDSIIVGEHGISLLAVLEDEVLSSLPLAPMHRDPAECARNETAAEVAKIATEGDAKTAEVNRPFANLAEMLNEPPVDDKD